LLDEYSILEAPMDTYDSELARAREIVRAVHANSTEVTFHRTGDLPAAISASTPHHAGIGADMHPDPPARYTVTVTFRGIQWPITYEGGSGLDWVAQFEADVKANPFMFVP
jgi:hypothetical protein